MLGEKIAEESGRVVGTRILSVDPPKVETTIQHTGKMLGHETTTSVTYTAVVRPDGLLEGEGQGITTTPEGEMVTFMGKGIGKMTGKGNAASFRAALFYNTASKKFAKLNEVIGVLEFEQDESGNTHGKVWEWK